MLTVKATFLYTLFHQTNLLIMKKLILKSALAAAALSVAGTTAAQEYVPFDMYGFMTKSDVSYDKPQAQQYVISKMIYTVDSTSPYFLSKQTDAFNSKVQIDNQWVKVSACYVRNGIMYAVRHSTVLGLNQISTYDDRGNETIVTDVPVTNGYITQAAYVEDEDMVYMVLSSPNATSADLYKAPGDNPANLTYVANISTTFMEKPFSFTYVHEKDLFFYVTNSAKLYSITREGEIDYYYGIHPDDPYLPSDGSDGSSPQYPDNCSGLVWSAPYNMLIWVCPRGGASGSALTYWYGMELIKGSETPVVHRLLNHVDSGLTGNYYNCLVSEAPDMSEGIPPAPTYVSCYRVNGKPGYYDISWAAVKNDVSGNPIEGEIYYNVYIGDKQIAKKDQPAKGITVGVRILLPHAYTEDTFYVGVETVTETGVSPLKVEGPIASIWDPDDAGSWYDPSNVGVNEILNSPVDVKVAGHCVTISGLVEEIANIFSVDGKLVYSLTGDSTVELQPGMYIVQTAGKTLKILVK